MLIKNGKSKELDKYMKEERLIVSVYAKYCGTCEMMAPVLEEVSKDVTVVKLNVDENQDFVTEQKISGTPAHFFFKEGKAIGRKEGFVPKEELLGVFK